MHSSLNKFLTVEEPEPVPPLRNTDAQLRTFALEAESNGDYLLAAQYYKQVSHPGERAVGNNLERKKEITAVKIIFILTEKENGSSFRALI
jgi:hypothetical protein